MTRQPLSSPASIALNRFGYGLARAEQVPRDPARYLLDQLAAFDPAPPAIAARTRGRGQSGEMLQLLRGLRRRMEDPDADGMSATMPEAAPGNPRAAALAGLPPEYREKLIEARRVVIDDLAVRVNVAVASPAPFAERLVHFWSNHFSVSVGKPGTQFEVGPHEFTAIRPHVLGRFSDMLKAAVLHPAMLLYLDQFQSIGPGSAAGQRRGRRAEAQPNAQPGPRGINENLAREILELHTLGVDGGYSQADITEFARALTGWTVPGIGRVGRFAADQPSGAAFVALAHEPGARMIMGKRYAAGGPEQAVAVLDDLAAHPATARHIATKLARHFAGDEPPAGLVTRLEADFLATGGDLASLTRTLIAAPEAWVPGPVKFRTPFEWFIAAARLSGIAGLAPQRIARVLSELGQSPWRAPSPAGYDDLAASWAAPDVLLRRVELAERLAQTAPADDVLGRAEAAFPDALSDTTRTMLARAESGRQALALLLVAPEMMRR